jgi:hypothetical protein
MDDGDSNSWLADKLPGTEVTLLIHPDKPDEVQRPGWATFFIAMILLAPGLFMLGLAVSQFKVTPGSIAMFAAALGFCAWKIKGMIIPREQRQSKEEYVAARAQRRKEKKAKKKDGGYILTRDEIRARLRFIDRQSLFIMPLVMFMGIGIIIGGLQLSNKMSGFAERGVATTGEIVAMNSRRNSDGDTMYYARIQFRTEQGERIVFDDNTGSSAPLKQTGEQVKVLYDSGNPENAVIDRGLFNWLGPVALIALGALMAVWSLKMLAGVASRAGRI